jgi:hypothetical protein
MSVLIPKDMRMATMKPMMMNIPMRLESTDSEEGVFLLLITLILFSWSTPGVLPW